jgi:hypothetical protein
MDNATQDAIDELNDPFGGAEEEEESAVVIPEERALFRIPSGKYKGAVLPKMVGIKPSYYDKVIALKEEIEQDPDFKRHASSIALTYAELRREAEAKAAELSDIKLRLAAAMLLMLEQYEVEGTTGLTLKNGDKIRWQPEPHLVVTDKETFRQWCLKNGLEREMVLPWGKANKMAKEMLLAGQPESEGAELFMRPKVVFEKGDKVKK